MDPEQTAGSTLFVIEASLSFQQKRKADNFCSDWRIKSKFPPFINKHSPTCPLMWSLMYISSAIQDISLVLSYLNEVIQEMIQCQMIRSDSVNQHLHKEPLLTQFHHLLKILERTGNNIRSTGFETIFLSINLNMCFGCPKEPSQCDSSFEYPQHMFWLRNKKTYLPIHTLI